MRALKADNLKPNEMNDVRLENTKLTENNKTRIYTFNQFTVRQFSGLFATINPAFRPELCDALLAPESRPNHLI